MRKRFSARLPRMRRERLAACLHNERTMTVLQRSSCPRFRFSAVVHWEVPYSIKDPNGQGQPEGRAAPYFGGVGFLRNPAADCAITPNVGVRLDRTAGSPNFREVCRT